MRGVTRRTVCAISMATVLSCTSGNTASEHEAPDTTLVAPLAAIEAQISKTDPCSWVAVADVARILGPLSAAPMRVYSAERADPDEGGSGCAYQVNPPSGDAYTVSVEVVLDGALALQTGLGATLPGLGEMAAGVGVGVGTGEGGSNGVDASGWDWSGGVGGIYAARQGHVAVIIADGAPGLGRKRLDSLAHHIVDGIPDMPFAATREDLAAAPSGRDPCALVSGEEAASILGIDHMQSYRSRETSPLAHSNGASCTYYLGRHRVLVVTPTWSDAGMAFRMHTAVARMVGSVLMNETASDTLDGPWDAVTTGVDGSLYMLTGDRMLAVEHGLSSVTETKLVALVRRAASRLQETQQENKR